LPRVQLPERHRIPDPHGSDWIYAGWRPQRGETPAIGAEHQTVGWLVELPRIARSAHIPATYRAIAAGRREPLTVRAEQQFVDLALVSAKQGAPAAGLELPQADRAVHARGGYELTVRAEVNGGDRSFMSRQRPEQFARGRIPDPHYAIG